MDRGYLDFARRYRVHQADSLFVTRAKSNLDARRVYSRPTDRASGIICDQRILLDGFYSHRDYSHQLRRIRFRDLQFGKTLVFLSNQTTLPALIICPALQSRWQVELLFKRIKWHLRIKRASMAVRQHRQNPGPPVRVPGSRDRAAMIIVLAGGLSPPSRCRLLL